MIKTYEKYMKRCVGLAKKGEGKVSPNPLVGAIVLDESGDSPVVKGMGWHKKYGDFHAEPNAIKNAEENGFSCAGATIVVNLEPCSHYGKNPPCADLILQKGFKKVVVGCVDPNPIVAGRGIEKLKNAGIEVIAGVLEEECKALNEIFIKNQTKKLPFISIKTASTMDGKIATKTGSSKWITGEKARADVQCLRNKYDAILTGSGTVIADDPSLTCRMKNGRNPIRIIIDSQLRVSPSAKVFCNDGTKTFVAVGEDVSIGEFGSHVEFIKCPLIEGKIDLNFLAFNLYEKGINSVLIEAGGFLNGAFVKAGLADKVYQYVAPKIVADSEARDFMDGFDLKDINYAVKLNIKSVKKFTPDIRFESYIQYI